MRYLTAGESHGPRLTAIIEGVPAGLPLTAEDINGDLKRRQGGYGRGGRMKIESDKVEITSGVRHGKTTGAPITLHVINKDHQKWLDIMAVEDIEDRLKTKRKITHPRPGHADLVGGMKYRLMICVIRWSVPVRVKQLCVWQWVLSLNESWLSLILKLLIMWLSLVVRKLMCQRI